MKRSFICIVMIALCIILLMLPNNISLAGRVDLEYPEDDGDDTVVPDYTVAPGDTAIPDNTVPVDVTAPIITISGVNSDGYYSTDVTLVISITDDSDIDEQSIILNDEPFESGTIISSEGTYTLSVSATDTAGNINTDSITFYIDKNPPTIVSPDDLEVEATGFLTIIEDLGTPAFSDSMDTEPKVTNNVPSDGFPLGLTVVTWTVTDRTGRSTNDEQNVTMVDTTPPVIELNDNNPMTIEVKTAYNESGANVTDNYDGNETVMGRLSINSTDVNMELLGTYKVIYNVSDTLGNYATEVERIVYVVDTTPPIITLLGDSFVVMKIRTKYVDAGADIVDNYDGDITAGAITSNPVDTNISDTYIVTYDIEDSSHNIATQVTRKVKVVNILPITIIDVRGTMEEGGIYSSGVNVSFKVVNNQSSIFETKYRINNGSWITYSKPFTISDNGVIYLEYFSEDRYNNMDATKVHVININKTLPIEEVPEEASEDAMPEPTIDILGINLTPTVTISTNESVGNDTDMGTRSTPGFEIITAMITILLVLIIGKFGMIHR